MKLTSACLAMVGLAGLLTVPALGQTPPQAGAQKQESSPLYRITVVARTTKAINYRHLSAPTQIDFQGTVLLPLARGRAKVQSKRGAVRIQARFEKIEPASRFGPEFLTYVLWAISPEGRAINLGEVQLQGQKSKLDVTAQLQAFALIVTAEPYFAVMQPSDVVVLENIVRPDTMGNIQEMDAKFDLLQRGQYSIVQGGFEPVRQDPRIPLSLLEARNAVQIAKAAGAENYAADSLKKAVQLLQTAERDQAAKRHDKKLVEMAAREAVQTAEDARAITAKRLDEERVEKERRASAEREAQARAQTEAAERAKLEAQLASERAARERAEAEAARAAALAQQQAAQEQAERARLDADRATRERAEADLARAAAQAQQQAAQADAERARRLAEAAERGRQQAEAEKAELRKRLLDQLNSVLQTRDTARGLIINMSDVLFDFGKYTLKPGAREKLAKISGIVLAHPGLRLQVEGHTDSVGSEEYNQLLSEQRAASVRDFLVQQGVPAGSVSARGFGKTQPVASNDTPEGRQRNRRVELVVTGESIGAAASETTNQ